MALRPKTTLLAVLILICAIPAVSCVKMRGPGIMPVIEEGAGGEWVVKSQRFDPARIASREQSFFWMITLQYIPGDDDRRIASAQISAAFDGSRIPFTFREEDQVLETSVYAVFGPSLTHYFVLEPGEGSSFQFPSFELMIP